MSQCHKCKYDSVNGGTIEQRQVHCPNCNFQECWSKTLKGHAPDGKPRIVELDNPNIHPDFIEFHAIDFNEGNDLLGELDLEESQVSMILDFCHNFQNLKLRTRLVALAMLDVGGNNTQICEACGLPRTTVIEKRKELESDPFWADLLRRARIHKRNTRTPVPRPSSRKGKKVKNPKKWGGKNILPDE